MQELRSYRVRVMGVDGSWRTTSILGTSGDGAVAKALQTYRGAQLLKRTFTMEQIEEAMENDGGFCTDCGEPAETFCEPDARHYPCAECGTNTVFGAQELVLMGRVR